jgi:hypothetical protein
MLLMQGTEVLFSQQLGRKGSVPAAIAALHAGLAIKCRVLAVQLVTEPGSEEEVLHALLGITPLQPFFDVEPDSQVGPAGVDRWSPPWPQAVVGSTRSVTFLSNTAAPCSAGGALAAPV